MKFKKLFLLLFLTLTAISCKDDKNKENTTSGQEENVAAANTFKVTLNVVVKKDDDFCLLYTEDGTINFQEGIWQEVKAAENAQNVEFSFPADRFPTQLRLDLGKQQQDGIFLNSIKMEYAGKVREFKGSEMSLYFRPDNNKCTLDATGFIKPIGETKELSLYPQEVNLGPEITKLVK